MRFQIIYIHTVLKDPASLQEKSFPASCNMDAAALTGATVRCNLRLPGNPDLLRIAANINTAAVKSGLHNIFLSQAVFLHSTAAHSKTASVIVLTGNRNTAAACQRMVSADLAAGHGKYAASIQIDTAAGCSLHAVRSVSRDFIAGSHGKPGTLSQPDTAAASCSSMVSLYYCIAILRHVHLCTVYKIHAAADLRRISFYCYIFQCDSLCGVLRINTAAFFTGGIVPYCQISITEMIIRCLIESDTAAALRMVILPCTACKRGACRIIGKQTAAVIFCRITCKRTTIYYTGSLVLHKNTCTIAFHIKIFYGTAIHGKVAAITHRDAAHILHAAGSKTAISV